MFSQGFTKGVIVSGVLGTAYATWYAWSLSAEVRELKGRNHQKEAKLQQIKEKEDEVETLVEEIKGLVDKPGSSFADMYSKGRQVNQDLKDVDALLVVSQAN